MIKYLDPNPFTLWVIEEKSLDHHTWFMFPLQTTSVYNTAKCGHVTMPFTTTLVSYYESLYNLIRRELAKD